MKNRKGYIGDILTIAVVLFVIGFLAVVFLKVWNGFDAGIQSSDVSADSKTFSSGWGDAWASGFDTALVFALVLCYSLTLFFAWNIGSTPGLFMLVFLVLVVMIGITAILGDVFAGTNTEEFVNERAAMPMTTWIGEHLFGISVAGGFLLVMVLFAKPGGGGA